MTENLLTTDIPEIDNSAPAGVPAKFWDSNAGQIRTDALLASYLALEKKLSQSVPIPQNDEDKKALHRLLGCPETANGYDVTVPSDVIGIDPELNARLHEKGFTNEQVQEVYDLATEKLVPLILDLVGEFQAEREVERLVEYFGSTDRWQEVARQLNDFGRKNLPPKAFEGMACSYDGVMALYQMMKSDKGSPVTKAQGVPPSELDEEGIKSLMQNPKYWREKDPAFIAKVTEGFQRLYESK